MENTYGMAEEDLAKRTEFVCAVADTPIYLY